MSTTDEIVITLALAIIATAVILGVNLWWTGRKRAHMKSGRGRT